MCLLFLYVCDTAADDGYRLILADNRDEFWDRPTNLAEFWGPKEEILSGVDMEPGREGGTWLGVSKNGKIGVLLNILGILEPNKHGRGSLITDYLKEELTNEQYVTQKILPIHQEYNKFNLILVDLRFPDDKQLLKQANMSNTPDNIRLERSAAFVWSPSIRYGTRTNTVVLVDKFGECEYIERTFKIPVDPENLGCQTKSYKFHMQPHNKL